MSNIEFNQWHLEILAIHNVIEFKDQLLKKSQVPVCSNQLKYQNAAFLFVNKNWIAK